jgi:tetratricopeptide (TPR) repeat protein
MHEVRRFVLVLSSILSVGSVALAQRTVGSSGSTAPRPSSTSSMPSEVTAIFIRGKVIFQNGLAPAEPIAIERVCSGAIRREAYSDFKGNFQFQLGQGSLDRSASEGGRDVFNNTGNRGPVQGMGSEVGIAGPAKQGDSTATRPELLGCELRASLPGFKSTSIPLRMNGGSMDLNVGALILTPMEGVEGTTISMASMAAPPEARRAYEKGEKALAAGKNVDAEKELNKAVQIYPGFASAWAMLGEADRQQAKFAAAKEAYAHAIAADAHFVSPYYGMAIVAVHEKSWDDAVKYTDQVAKLNATAFPLIYMYNAAANYYLGKLDVAEQSAIKFKSFNEASRYPEAELVLANILMGKRDYAGAARELEEYLKLAPNAANVAAINSQLKQLREMSVAKQK